MVCAPVRSIIPSLKLGDYLSIQAHKLCSISHLENEDVFISVNTIFYIKVSAKCILLRYPLEIEQNHERMTKGGLPTEGTNGLIRGLPTEKG